MDDGIDNEQQILIDWQPTPPTSAHVGRSRRVWLLVKVVIGLAVVIWGIATFAPRDSAAKSVGYRGVPIAASARTDGQTAMPATSASFDASKPQGRPIDPSRSDWLITQTDAQHLTNEAMHGLDFAFPGNQGAMGSPIHATQAGEATPFTDMATLGNGVYILGYIDPATGVSYHTVYGHFVAQVLTATTTVKRGDLIGKMGSTGASTGPHSHYEVWVCQWDKTQLTSLHPGMVQHASDPGTCQPVDPQPFTEG